MTLDKMNGEAIARLDLASLVEVAPVIARDSRTMARDPALAGNDAACTQLIAAAAAIDALLKPAREAAQLAKFQAASHSSLQAKVNEANKDKSA